MNSIGECQIKHQSSKIGKKTDYCYLPNIFLSKFLLIIAIINTIEDTKLIHPIPTIKMEDNSRISFGIFATSISLANLWKTLNFCPIPAVGRTFDGFHQKRRWFSC